MSIIGKCDPAWHDGKLIPATYLVRPDQDPDDRLAHGMRATCNRHLARSVEAVMEHSSTRKVTVLR